MDGKRRKDVQACELVGLSVGCNHLSLLWYIPCQFNAVYE